MTCPTGYRLQACWYNACDACARKEQQDLHHTALAPYRVAVEQAFQAYRQHRQECELCRRDLAQDARQP